MKIKTLKNRKGIAFLLSIIVMMILFIFGAAYLTSMISETGIARNQQHSEQAFFIAEAGMQRAIRLLVDDQTWKTSSLIENMSDGYYEVVVDDDPVYPERTRITSTGYVGRASRTTRITIIITGGFDYAIFSDDTSDPVLADIDCSTATGNIRGDVHANGTALMGGVSLSDGTLTQGELGGPMLNNIEIEMPFHRDHATIIYPGGTVINSQKIQDELIYVEGDVTIDCTAKKGVSFTQTSLIAEGNINIIGQYRFKIDEYNYPGNGKVVALATKTGNITSTGANSIQDRDIKGLIFSEQGNINFDYLKTDAAVYSSNTVFTNVVDIDYKVKRFPTVGFIFGIQLFDWEEVFVL